MVIFVIMVNEIVLIFYLEDDCHWRCFISIIAGISQSPGWVERPVVVAHTRAPSVKQAAANAWIELLHSKAATRRKRRSESAGHCCQPDGAAVAAL